MQNVRFGHSMFKLEITNNYKKHKVSASISLEVRITNFAK